MPIVKSVILFTEILFQGFLHTQTVDVTGGKTQTIPH